MDFAEALDSCDRQEIAKHRYMAPERIFDYMLKFLYERRVHRFIRMIDNGFDITFANKYSETLLHIAAYRGMEDMVVLLVRWGLDVNALNIKKETPLCMACKQKNPAIVWLLLLSGADPEYTDPMPIRFAVERSYYDHVQALLTIPLSHIPIHDFVSNIKVLEMCIRTYPRYMYVTDRFGDTILHRVIDKNMTKTLKMLMTYKPDLTLTNYHGETPLQTARSKNRKEMIKILEMNQRGI